MKIELTGRIEKLIHIQEYAFEEPQGLITLSCNDDKGYEYNLSLPLDNYDNANLFYNHKKLKIIITIEEL